MNDRRGFSKAQQGFYRPMVDEAWTAATKRDPILLQAADKAAARRQWYERELEAATGKDSTMLCDRKRDFESAMAHFESIAGNGIYWNVRVYGGDARRIAFCIREIVTANDVEEEYMRGMARRMLCLDDDAPLPELALMEYAELIIIMGELKRYLRRVPLGRPRGRPPKRRRREPDPF